MNKNCCGIVHTYEGPGTVHSKGEIRRKRNEEESERKKEHGRKGSWFRLRYCVDICEISSSHSGVAEDSVLLGSYAAYRTMWVYVVC